jgi:branched-chain amino acid transport system substrate-binding protein
MGAIAEVVKRLGAAIDGDKAMEILKGMRINSPRGPILIDRETRDIVQTVYIRRVERINGQLYNTEFEKFADVKDPGK